MDSWFYLLTHMLHDYSSETLSLGLFFICTMAILLLFRLFQAPGLFVYNALITVIANVQVLKLAHFGYSPEPVALGTVTFATAFLVSDILTEHYGKTTAQQGVWLSFSAQILMASLMLITLGHKPVDGDVCHQAMEVLFLPSPRLLIASLTAFALSQLFDIMVFKRLSQVTHGKMLWLRTNVSTILSALLDNIIFSTIAWVLLAPTPVSWKSLIYTYILGTYFARVLVSVMSTPVIYLSYLCIKK
jgi:uncharacterized integral membrane protein (TIGR00697 family)